MQGTAVNIYFTVVYFKTIVQSFGVKILYFSAIVEHTKQVIFLEDDDVAVVEGGGNIFNLFIDLNFLKFSSHCCQRFLHC